MNGFLGGAFGQGLDDNIRLAYEWLIENYREGDEIFIFGFSRGAYTASALAGLDILAEARQQLARYPTVKLVNARADSVSGATDKFSVLTGDG